MLQFLINILMPIFTKMGVSPTDVETYVHDLSGYIYAITGTLLLMIVVMIAAHFLVKKGTRHVIRWGAGIAWVLVVTVLANVICFGPMYNNLSIILDYDGGVSEESAANSAQVIQEVGEEGTVLLKNDGVLPMQNVKKINVFGWDSVNPIYGGTGSGATDETSAVSMLQAFANVGFETNAELSQMYRDYRESRPVAAIQGGTGTYDMTLPEPTQEYYTDELMNNAKEFSDVAIVVIGRPGGEGFDLPEDMNALIHGTYDKNEEYADGNENYTYTRMAYENNGDYDDFDPGEHFLQLSNTEEAMIEKVCSEFEQVIVVINSNNTMELGWLNDYKQIQAAVLAPGGGANGFTGLAEILHGDINPSGKTVDTFPYKLNESPVFQNIGNFSFNNVEDLKTAFTEADPAYQGNIAFVNYVENIYLGYKYYETTAEEGAINYDSTVMYPFGYGLSYTTFSQNMENFEDYADRVSFDVTVTNTGEVAGKDIIQVYDTPPYTNGGIEKASVNLVDFEKTKMLEPGESQTISFDIAKENLASYDSKCLKTQKGGYVLEAGEYTISIRENSHDVLDSEVFQVEKDIDYSESGRSSDQSTAVNQFQDYSAGKVNYLSRANHFENLSEAISKPTEDLYVMDDVTRQAIKETSVAYYDPEKYDNPDDEMPVTGAKNGLELVEMRGKDYTDEQWETLLDQLTVDELFNMVNLGGFQTIAVNSVGKVRTLDSDGPAGLNDWYIGVYGTSFPTAEILAQTWNKKLADRVGNAVGAEYRDSKIYGWYGPAMNIHRNPFSGRNFEYYSEDGVLSGYMASQVINGSAKTGVYAYIKHFAMNEQEMNRCSFLLTYSDEQAIREIYLKPFEMCVKNYESKSLAVMSSFNFIGDIYSGANPQLLNNVLRDEWGFEGMVMTDWDGSYGYQITDESIRNGNDLMLGFLQHDSNQMSDLDSPTLVKAMRQAAKNIMYTVVNSAAYEEENLNTGLSPMKKLFIAIDTGVAISSIVIMGIVVFRWRKKKKYARSEGTVENAV